MPTKLCECGCEMYFSRRPPDGAGKWESRKYFSKACVIRDNKLRQKGMVRRIDKTTVGKEYVAPQKVILRDERLLGRYISFLEKQGKTFNFILALICTALLAAIDWVEPNDFSLDFLYLLPIVLTTWLSGKGYGYIMSAICAATWTINKLSANSLTLIWNIVTSFGIFMFFVALVCEVRKLMQNENRMVRTDPLTEVMNSRAFYEIVGYEILKEHRHSAPFSLGFIDLDNFKQVNDRYGHKKGDQVLKAVATCLVQHLRKTDVVARYGGDEFVVYLPDTDLTAAQVAIGKVREFLLKTLEKYDLVVTCSIGIVTCIHPPDDLDEVVSLADNMMYEVKRSGKNNVRYELFARPASQR